MITASIFDDSLNCVESKEQKVNVIGINIFAKNRNQLPKVRFAGDVVRFHRVKLQSWSDELQLLGMRDSSYVVCRGNKNCLPHMQDGSYEFLPTANSELSVRVEDRLRLTKLWAWAQQRIRVYPTLNTEHSFRLERLPAWNLNNPMVENVTGDCTLLVGAIIACSPGPTSPVGNPCGIIRAWDGTGISGSDPLLVHSHVALEAIRDGDPPTAALTSIAEVVMKHLQGINPPKALAGRVINVLIWEQSHWDLVTEAVNVGSFVSLRNVEYNLIPSTRNRCLQVHGKSSLTPMPTYAYEVLDLLRNHNNRLLRHETLNSDSGILPLDYTETRGLQQSFTNRTTESRTTMEPRILMPRKDCVRRRLVDLEACGTGSEFEVFVRLVDCLPPLSNLSSRGIEKIVVSSYNGNEEVSSFRLALCVVDSADVSTETHITTIVDSNVGEVLFGMSARGALNDQSAALFNLQRIMNDTSRKWAAKIRSVKHHGRKFFLMVSLKEL